MIHPAVNPTTIATKITGDISPLYQTIFVSAPRASGVFFVIIVDMIQGPPQTPLNPDKMEFKVLRLSPETFILKAGEDTTIFLESIDEYFCVNFVSLHEDLQGRGIAYKLYNEALNFAKTQRKKGIISSGIARHPATEHIWQRFKQEGRATEVRIKNRIYDALLC